MTWSKPAALVLSIALAAAVAAALWLLRPPPEPLQRSFEEPILEAYPLEPSPPLAPAPVERVAPRAAPAEGAAPPPARAPDPAQPPDVLTGIVRDPHGAPHADARVFALPWIAESREYQDFRTARRATSGPEGRYEVEVRLDRGFALAGVLVDDTGAPIVKARVDALAPDPRRGPRRSQATTDADGRFLISALEAIVYGLRSEPVGCDEIVLTGLLPPMSGLVLRVPRRGTVTALLRVPPGSPLPERVTVFRPAARDSSEMHATSRPWNEGRFELAGIPTGRVRLRFCVDGLAPASRELYVEPGARVDLGEVLMDAGFCLDGRVLDQKDRPVAHALVHSGGTRDASWRSATTRADGSFRMESLVEGELDLHVEADGFLPARRRSRVAAAGPLVVKLQVACRIRGEVRNAGGQAAAGVQVTVRRDAERLWSAWTDAEGRFEASVPAGRYRLTARRAMEPEVQTDLEVPEGEPTAVLLTLSN